MNRVFGIILVAVGIVLLVFGVNESQSFASDVSKFFSGNPTNHSMWLILLGVLASVGGLVLAFLPVHRT